MRIIEFTNEQRTCLIVLALLLLYLWRITPPQPEPHITTMPYLVKKEHVG